jgi:protein transport protein HofC
VSTETQFDAEDVVLPAEARRSRTQPRLRLRHLLYAVFYSALVLWTGVMTGLVLISDLLGVAFALVFAGTYIYAGRRSTQQDALLWALAVTAQRGMPMASTLDAFAAQCSGEYQRKVRAGAHYLRQGLTISEVTACEPGLFPRDAIPLIHTGHDCGTLATAPREAAEMRARLRGPWTGLAVRIAYLLWVLVALQMITAFISYFILPKYEAIFADFGIPLPQVTVQAIMVSHFFVRYMPFYLLFVAFQLGLLMLATVSAMGVLPWDLPFVGRIFHRRHVALVLRCVAHIVEANRPLARGIESLVRTYPAEAIRYRLLCVVRDLDAGDDWCESLAAHGFLSAGEVALLESARRVGNLPWALRQIAESGERRLTYRVQMIVQWLLPLFILAVGTLVFFLIVAYFTPLLVLIEKLAS